jgi:quercetin dioxygenase-like cupin family protein
VAAVWRLCGDRGGRQTRRRKTVADYEVLDLDHAHETRSFDKGKLDLANVTDAVVGRVTLEPGWRWSECVKPIAQTDSCQAPHTGYVVAGKLHVVMDDGSEFDIGAGDAYYVAPGHDAWVVGSDAYVGIDFTGLENYAKQ